MTPAARVRDPAWGIQLQQLNRECSVSMSGEQSITPGEGGPQNSMTGSEQRNGDHAVRRLDHFVDETLKASFPASDPPGWTLGGSRRDLYEPEDIKE